MYVIGVDLVYDLIKVDTATRSQIVVYTVFVEPVPFRGFHLGADMVEVETTETLKPAQLNMDRTRAGLPAHVVTSISAF
jgi:hypothetical protein